MRINLSDNGRLQRYAMELAALTRNAPTELAASLNKFGSTLRRQTISAEAKQVGLPVRVLSRAQKEQRASAGDLRYRITVAGGNIALKYFRPREVGKGVVSLPMGIERISPGAFLRGGRAPNRVPLKKGGGNVFLRAGSGPSPLKLLKSGVYLGDELLKGETAAAFEGGANQAIGIVMSDLVRLLPK